MPAKQAGARDRYGGAARRRRIRHHSDWRAQRQRHQQAVRSDHRCREPAVQPDRQPVLRRRQHRRRAAFKTASTGRSSPARRT
jgi:hypothetical protein